MRNGTDRVDVKALFEKLQLPPDAWSDFQNQFLQEPAIELAQTSGFTKAISREFFRDTWFAMDGCPALAKTQRGSRPGDPVADLCFTFALSRILQGVEEEILQKFPSLHTPWNGLAQPDVNEVPDMALGIVHPIWADDIAIALHAPDPQLLLDMTKFVAGKVFDRLAVGGLRPNLGKGNRAQHCDQIQDPNLL